MAQTGLFTASVCPSARPPVSVSEKQKHSRTCMNILKDLLSYTVTFSDYRPIKVNPIISRLADKLLNGLSIWPGSTVIHGNEE